MLTAGDGKEGTQVFREHAGVIQVVLLDMTMPRMDGGETFQAIRALRPDARVILMSGYSEQEAVNRFARDGIAGFLQKPFGLSDLVEVVKRALDG